MTRDGWDPETYQRFRSERAAPFHDLLALVEPRPEMRVVDLGCGTGELTALAHRTFKARETRGFDRSREMLSRAPEEPGLRFERRDIAEFADRGAWDLVLSNAALHWLPDHPTLFQHLYDALAPEGQLAVQMPAQQDHPTHRIAAGLAAEAPFAAHITGRPGESVLAPEDYTRILWQLGFARQTVRLQIYPHILLSRDHVVEWVRGSTLTFYAERLPADLFARFIALYRERLLGELEDARPYLFPFRRILLWARR
jgi:trans-aconitate 2-methyltransferase